MGSHGVQFCLPLFQATSVLAHLSIIDIIIIASYFVMVVWIGFYLKGKSNTGLDFFMAGRQMTVWIAGLSFLSANLGSHRAAAGNGSGRNVLETSDERGRILGTAGRHRNLGGPLGVGQDGSLRTALCRLLSRRQSYGRRPVSRPLGVDGLCCGYCSGQLLHPGQASL